MKTLSILMTALVLSLAPVFCTSAFADIKDRGGDPTASPAQGPRKHFKSLFGVKSTTETASYFYELNATIDTQALENAGYTISQISEILAGSKIFVSNPANATGQVNGDSAYPQAWLQWRDSLFND